MFDFLIDRISESPWTYAVVLGVVAFDAIVPLLPSETALITGGVLAERGDLLVALLVFAGAAGAVAGDSVLFLAGRRSAGWLRRRLFSGERSRRRLDWMRRHLHDRTWLLIVADFIPAGRTAAMFAAGMVDVPPRRFYAFIVPGALLWALLHTLLGYLGGSVFEGSFWAPLLASVAVAVLLSVVLELVERRTQAV